MRYIWAATVVSLVGCINAVPTSDSLSATQDRKALAAFVTAHPGEFVSPGRAESAADILKAPVGDQTSGHVNIALFAVDLDKKTYSLVHGYGELGSGWFEYWTWDGRFVQMPDDRWTVEKPNFTKDWGE